MFASRRSDRNDRLSAIDDGTRFGPRLPLSSRGHVVGDQVLGPLDVKATIAMKPQAEQQHEPRDTTGHMEIGK